MEGQPSKHQPLVMSCTVAVIEMVMEVSPGYSELVWLSESLSFAHSAQMALCRNTSVRGC